MFHKQSRGGVETRPGRRRDTPQRRPTAHFEWPPVWLRWPGWLCDRYQRWHRVLSLYLVTQGIAFVLFTRVGDFAELLVVSLIWGFSSTLTSVSTQAA